MTVKSSPEIVRDMEKTIQGTVKSIQSIQQSIQGAIRASANWNDEKGQQYRDLMKKIAQATQAPSATLSVSVPKLEKLAVALDKYNKVKFN